MKSLLWFQENIYFVYFLWLISISIHVNKVDSFITGLCYIFVTHLNKDNGSFLQCDVNICLIWDEIEKALDYRMRWHQTNQTPLVYKWSSIIQLPASLWTNTTTRSLQNSPSQPSSNGSSLFRKYLYIYIYKRQSELS